MKRIAILMVLTMLLAGTASAATPKTMTYQGVLAVPGAGTVDDGSYNITFSLYDESSGGSALWSETSSVDVVSGIFNVILGQQNPLDLDFDRQYWLGLKIGEGSELTPRTGLTSTPYALYAHSFADGSVTADKVADGTVVRSINTLQDSVTIAAGANVVISKNDKTLTISAVNDGGGTAITSLAAGAGLTGGGTSGEVTIAVAENGLQSGMVAAAQLVKSLNGLKDDVILRAEGGATLTVAGDTIKINAGSGGSGMGIQGLQSSDPGIEIISPNGPTTTVNLRNLGIGANKIAAGEIVKSINTLTDDVILKGGGNVTITPNVDTLTISATGGNTLDNAYDQGGTGAGRNIDADAGAVNISNVGGLTVEGNTGIGTTTPLQKLQVVGNIQISLADTFVIGTQPVAWWNDVDTRLVIGSPVTGLAFYAGDPLARMTINPSTGDLNVRAGIAAGGQIESQAGGFRFPDGTIQTTASLGGQGWGLNGNAGTSAGTNFLGTTDEQDIVFKVNSVQALLLEYPQVSEGEIIPNIIGGHGGNSVSAGTWGAVISGGGSSGSPNQISNLYAAIGGGRGNSAQGLHSTISGGRNNNAISFESTIGGGENNTTTGVGGTVAGGTGNRAATGAAVAGGNSNSASGNYSAIPGGRENIAKSIYSLAAGRRARANTQGSFVWSDSEADSMVSTGNDQFLIDAAGGVGIGTNSPDEALDVDGTVQMTGFKLTASPAADYVLTSDANGLGTWKADSLNNNEIKAVKIADDQVVKSLNSLKDDIDIVGDGSISVTANSENNEIELSLILGSPSSRRWKSGITTLENAVETVRNLRGVSFNWKEDGRADIGVIAEEVGLVIPEIVTFEDNGVDAKRVRYEKLVAVLIEAVKEQQRQIDELKAQHAEINHLKKMVESLRMQKVRAAGL